MTINNWVCYGQSPDAVQCPACPGKLVKNANRTRFICERGCGTEQYVGSNGRPIPGILSGPLAGQSRHPAPLT